jgi:hypothetical protein
MILLVMKFFGMLLSRILFAGGMYKLVWQVHNILFFSFLKKYIIFFLITFLSLFSSKIKKIQKYEKNVIK